MLSFAQPKWCLDIMPHDAHHVMAHEWWDAQLSGASPVCLCWTVLGAFIRIGTNPRVFERPLSLDQALSRVQSWLDQPCTRIIHPIKVVDGGIEAWEKTAER